MTGLSGKVRIVITVNLVLAMGALALVYEGFIANQDVLPFGLAAFDRPAAERAYQNLPQNAASNVRAAAARRLLRAAPAEAQTWNALSYVEFLKHGGLSPSALAALDHSYAISAFDPQSAVWRIGYGLENWPDLSSELRADVIVESAITLDDPTTRDALKARLRTIKNPAGRLAAAMILTQP